MSRVHAALTEWVAPLLAGVLALPGCSAAPAKLTGGPVRTVPADAPGPVLAPADREAVARCLHGVSLSDGVRVRPGPGGRRHLVTVEEALAEVGAHAGEDGKVYGRDGREVRFWHNRLAGRGTPWSTEEARAVQEELEELKRQYTVIEFDYYPGEENGQPPPIICSPAR